MLDSFRVLSQTRQSSGFGAGPIGLAEMRACLDEQGVMDRKARLEFIGHIAAMDEVFFEWMREKHGPA